MRPSHISSCASIRIMSSLIPSRQFVFSPDLAATIGLEEAVLLQCLSEASQDYSAETQGNFSWYQLDAHYLEKKLPFWSRNDIGRIAENLRQKGIILLASPPLGECGYARFAFNENSDTQASPTSSPTNAPIPSQANIAKPITASWEPDESAMRLLGQQGVPENFARECLPEFLHYWSERGEARHAWGNRYANHVMRKWRDYEARINREKKEIDIPSWAIKTTRANEMQTIDKNWQPSVDALEILEIQAGIHRNFIEDAVPEFVLYWSEKGELSNTWSTRFISHVKRQWAKCQHELKNDLEPRPIEPNWQPMPEVYDVLQLAHIELEFAKSLIPSFVVYWRDRNELRPSWNTVFLQWAKQQWKLKHSEQGQRATRDRTIAEDLTDRSWAS